MKEKANKKCFSSQRYDREIKKDIEKGMKNAAELRREFSEPKRHPSTRVSAGELPVSRVQLPRDVYLPNKYSVTLCLLRKVQDGPSPSVAACSAS